MKSHRNAGQITLRGRKTKTLSCGCCEVINLKDKFWTRYYSHQAHMPKEYEVQK